MMATKRILIYLALLPFSFLLFALGWLFIAPSHLYHCWDDAPPFLISWYPPFIHPWADSTDGKLRDYYLAPEWVVYLLWLSFIAGVFLLPALVVWRAARKRDTHITGSVKYFTPNTQHFGRKSPHDAFDCKVFDAPSNKTA